MWMDDEWDENAQVEAILREFGMLDTPNVEQVEVEEVWDAS